MNSCINFNYSTPALGRMLVALVVCAVAGCWEEIPYTGPPPGTAPAPRNADDEEEPETAAVTEDIAESFSAAEEPESAVDESTGDSAADAAATDETAAAPPAAAPDDAESFDDALFGDVPSDAESSAPDDSDLFAPLEDEADPPVDEPSPFEPASAPADGEHNTRRVAWLLGSKLSLAALANDRGVPAADVSNWYRQAEALATLLGTSAAELPPRTTSADAAEPPEAALDYLFSQGRDIGRDLAGMLGDDHAALFELAVKSNILLALYRPGANVTDALAEAISHAGRRAALPEALYQPLLEQISDGAPPAVLRDAVFQLHADVDRYLSTTP